MIINLSSVVYWARISHTFCSEYGIVFLCACQSRYFCLLAKRTISPEKSSRQILMHNIYSSHSIKPLVASKYKQNLTILKSTNLGALSAPIGNVDLLRMAFLNTIWMTILYISNWVAKALYSGIWYIKEILAVYILLKSESRAWERAT